MTAGDLLDDALALRVELLPADRDRAVLLGDLYDHLDRPWAPIAEMWADPALRPRERPDVPMPGPARRRKAAR